MKAIVFFLLAFFPLTAQAQLTQRCKGETWAELASARYQDAQLADILARYNRQADQPTCKKGRFVRFITTIAHEVRLGQTIDAIAARFTQAPGGADLIRSHNGLSAGEEPDAGRTLELPAELALTLGSRPRKELEAIAGLPSPDEILKYNGLRRFKRGGTVYVPLFIKPKEAPPPPPPPPVVVAPDPSEVLDPDDSEGPPGREPPSSTEPPPSAEASFEVLAVEAAARFDQFLHLDHAVAMDAGYRCATCHVDDPRTDGAYKPIDTGLCTRCHSAFMPTDSVLRDRKLTLTFSHDQHMSEEREVKKEGYNTTCNLCHAANQPDDGLRNLAAHAQCVRCHNQNEVQPAVDRDCAGCHAPEESWDRFLMARALLWEHYRQGSRQTDIKFGHTEHVTYLAGAESEEAACDRCHEDARTADTLEIIEPQRMADCLECHRGLKKEMGQTMVSLNRCQTCHYATGPGAMPTFGAVLAKPTSHTLTFRRRHARQAAEDDGVCASCHTELAGASGQSCDNCHRQTRPRDHTPRWREEPHGRSAVRNAERCSTCHLEDRCADCHAVAPRDHFPRTVFQTRHGRQARTSIRRCQTCHLPQVDCARCHDIGL